MAMFSKSKNQEPVVPQVCSRCEVEDGSVRLHFVAAPGPTSASTPPRPIWLCAACQSAVLRSAPGN